MTRHAVDPADDLHNRSQTLAHPAAGRSTCGGGVLPWTSRGSEKVVAVGMTAPRRYEKNEGRGRRARTSAEGPHTYHNRLTARRKKKHAKTWLIG